MADRRAKYKEKGHNFGNAELRRIDRIETQVKRRKEIRSHNFSRLRSLNEDTKPQIPGKSNSTVSRNERLEKWKQEKEVKKKSEKKVVKPPFKVGIVHHRAFSPPYNNSSLPSCSHWNSNSNSKSNVQQQTTPLKRITRVTQKRLAAKAAAKAAEEASAKKSFAPLNHKFKPPTGLPNIPLFGRVRKGSMDASKFSWNISDKRTSRKSEIQNSAKSERKMSNSLSLDSPRRSKKFKASLGDEKIQNSAKSERQISNSLLLDSPRSKKSKAGLGDEEIQNSAKSERQISNSLLLDSSRSKKSKAGLGDEEIQNSAKSERQISNSLLLYSPRSKKSKADLGDEKIQNSAKSERQISNSLLLDTPRSKKSKAGLGDEEIQNSAKSERKISNSLSRDSLRRSKKSKASLGGKEIQNSPKVVNTRLSVARKKQASDLSTDSLSLQVSSDDTEVFDSPIAESSSMNVETQKKESALTETFVNFEQPLETNQISSSKSDEDLQSNSLKSSPVFKDNLQINLTRTETDLEQDSDNYSLRLQVTDLSEQGVNSSKSAEQILEELPQTESEKIDALPSEIAEKSLSDTLNAAFFSPYVVTRRGKKEARKEQQIRRGFKRSPEEIPTKETVMQNLNISIDEEKRTAQYFKCLLDSETNRLSDQCDFWDDIIEKENPPEEAKAIAEQAIGQTKLLLRSKFKQFAGLVQRCEEGDGGQLVTCKDLQGFWDMLSVTVKNCESRFEKVEELRARNWKEEEEQQPQQLDVKRVVPARKRLPSKKKSPAETTESSSKNAPGTSSLRAMILAARQKKKEMQENLEVKPNDEQLVEIWKNVVKESPTKVTNSNRRLSIAPQDLSSKERRLSFPRAAIMISQKCKIPSNQFSPSMSVLKTQEEIDNEMDTEVETVNVQVHLDESISYINSKQTPGKSILKRIKIESDSSDLADDSRLLKSTQKVIFNDTVELKEVEVDKEAEKDTEKEAEKETNKLDLTSTLARIDSTEFDEECVPEVRIRAEKKLNFEDMSFNEITPLTEDEVFEEKTREILKPPEYNIIPPTPKSIHGIRQTTSDLENSFVEETDQRIITRVTRNSKATSSLQVSSLDRIKVKKITSKSPGSAKKNKVNSELGNSLLGDAAVEEEEGMFSRSLRSRTIVGSLTPRSARKLNKENSNSSKLGISPLVKKDISFQHDKENLNNSQLNKTDDFGLNLMFSHSLRSSKKILGSPKLSTKSPKHNKKRKIEISTPGKDES